MPIEIRPISAARHDEAVRVLATVFGFAPIPERIEMMREMPEFVSRMVAMDGESAVGAIGALNFDMSLPVGRIGRTAGLTMVGVIPTHRRRGILTAMMKAHFADCRERGQALSSLWASEGGIYARFGYGISCHGLDLDIERSRTRFVGTVNPSLRVRLLSEEEAIPAAESVWAAVRAQRPGMMSRSTSWWKGRRFCDEPWLRAGAPPMHRVVVEGDSGVEAYGLYRFHLSFAQFPLSGRLEVIEALGRTPDGTARLWKYFFDQDLVGRIEVKHLPVDHPLHFLLDNARWAHAIRNDTLWVRLVNVEQALRERSYGSEARVTFALTDTFCAENEGTYEVWGPEGNARRTHKAPDVSMEASALGSAYLGGISFQQLADAGKVCELRRGAIADLDSLFRSPRAPHCPDIF